LADLPAANANEMRGISMRIRYGISGGMTSEQIRRIHDTALRILDEIGFQVRTSELPETAFRTAFGA
jgi:trimethylamine:corrinoid methyltransferase-like protein